MNSTANIGTVQHADAELFDVIIIMKKVNEKNIFIRHRDNIPEGRTGEDLGGRRSRLTCTSNIKQMRDTHMRQTF